MNSFEQGQPVSDKKIGRLLSRTIAECKKALIQNAQPIDTAFDASIAEQTATMEIGALEFLIETETLDPTAANTVSDYLLHTENQPDADAEDCRLWHIAGLVQRVATIYALNGDPALRSSEIEHCQARIYADPTLPATQIFELIELSTKLTGGEGLDHSNPDDVAKVVDQARKDDHIERKTEMATQRYLDPVYGYLRDRLGDHDSMRKVAEALVFSAVFESEAVFTDEQSRQKSYEIVSLEESGIAVGALVDIGYSESVADQVVYETIDLLRRFTDE